MIRTVTRLILSMVVSSCIALSAQAVPFDTDLVISATMDDPFSITPGPGASRSGLLTLTSGGTGTTVNVVTSPGSLPLAGNLTDIGDGTRVDISASGTGLMAVSSTTVDTTFSLTNTSTNKIFQVDFLATYDMSVAANGDDAFTTAAFEVHTTAVDIFADSFFGPLTASVTDSFSFSILLNPLTNVDILGLADAFGIVNLAGFGSSTDDYLSQVDASIALTAVSSTLVAMPVPGTLFILGLGLAGLGVIRWQSIGRLRERGAACAPA